MTETKKPSKIKVLLGKPQELVMKLIRQRQLKKLHTQLINGAMFLRIVNDELTKLPRAERKRLVREIYKDGKLGDEIIARCEVKSDYMIRAMQGRLKVFKKKKKAENKKLRSANQKAFKQATAGAQPVKPTVKTKADETTVDGAKYYEKVKQQEAEGKLPEQQKAQ